MKMMAQPPTSRWTPTLRPSSRWRLTTSELFGVGLSEEDRVFLSLAAIKHTRRQKGEDLTSYLLVTNQTCTHSPSLKFISEAL